MPGDELEVLVADNTLAALGDVFGLTGERVRRILAARGVTTRLGHKDTRLAAQDRA
jgi:DNA-directed RNA polymerase sigma subunit (sigma70/sigma32)